MTIRPITHIIILVVILFPYNMHSRNSDAFIEEKNEAIVALMLFIDCEDLSLIALADKRYVKFSFREEQCMQLEKFKNTEIKIIYQKRADGKLIITYFSPALNQKD